MILVVDHYDSFVYNLVQLIESLGRKTEVVRSDAEPVPALLARKPEAVLLSPGPGHPSDAGCFTALSALELYAEAFDAAGALDKLEGFASHHGPDFYDLPRNTGSVTLRREAWELPASVPFGDASLKPLRAGETLAWKQA